MAKAAIDEAAKWFEEHPEFAIVGSVIIIGGISYIIISGGSGVVLVPLLAI